MRANRVKRVMREGKLALGSSVSFRDPQIIELIGMAGFDASYINMEHTDFDLPLISDMLRATELAGITSLVRVPQHDATMIGRLLDMGVEGIIVPHVDGIEGAKRAVDAVRYPPVGHRLAAAGTRASGYGTVPWEEHARQSNEEILLSVITDTESGIRDIENIAAVDGIDLIAIGGADLSTYLGTRDQVKLRAKLNEICDRIKKVGKARLQLPIGDALLPLTIPDLLELGGRYANMQPRPAGLLLRSLTDQVQSTHRAAEQAVK